MELARVLPPVQVYWHLQPQQELRRRGKCLPCFGQAEVPVVIFGMWYLKIYVSTSYKTPSGFLSPTCSYALLQCTGPANCTAKAMDLTMVTVTVPTRLCQSGIALSAIHSGTEPS